MTWTDVTYVPIQPAAVLERVGASEDGAVAFFMGIVRNANEGRPVSGLEYDGYRRMAKAQLSAIVAEAAERAESDRVAAVHRLGPLGIGEVSVAIAVSAPHRAQAFEAARFVIEEIKKRLPVWKREHYLDGETAWLDGHVPATERGGVR